MIKRPISICLSSLGLLFFMFSCDSTTVFTSEPLNCEVIVNGKYIGKTPVKYKTLISNTAEINVQISGKQYETIDTIIKKDGKINPVNRTLGYLFIYPFDFDRDFQKEYRFVLKENTVEKENQTEEDASFPLHSELTKSSKLKLLWEEYKAGNISKKEFEKKRKQILKN